MAAFEVCYIEYTIGFNGVTYTKTEFIDLSTEENLTSRLTDRAKHFLMLKQPYLKEHEASLMVIDIEVKQRHKRRNRYISIEGVVPYANEMGYDDDFQVHVEFGAAQPIYIGPLTQSNPNLNQMLTEAHSSSTPSPMSIQLIPELSPEAIRSMLMPSDQQSTPRNTHPHQTINSRALETPPQGRHSQGHEEIGKIVVERPTRVPLPADKVSLCVVLRCLADISPILDTLLREENISDVERRTLCRRFGLHICINARVYGCPTPEEVEQMAKLLTASFPQLGKSTLYYNEGKRGYLFDAVRNRKRHAVVQPPFPKNDYNRSVLNQLRQNGKKARLAEPSSKECEELLHSVKHLKPDPANLEKIVDAYHRTRMHRQNYLIAHRGDSSTRALMMWPHLAWMKGIFNMDFDFIYVTAGIEVPDISTAWQSKWAPRIVRHAKDYPNLVAPDAQTLVQDVAIEDLDADQKADLALDLIAAVLPCRSSERKDVGRRYLYREFKDTSEATARDEIVVEDKITQPLIVKMVTGSTTKYFVLVEDVWCDAGKTASIALRQLLHIYYVLGIKYPSRILYVYNFFQNAFRLGRKKVVLTQEMTNAIEMIENTVIDGDVVH